MFKKVLILIQVLLVLCLLGCNDKLTKETAKDVLEKELFIKQPKRYTTLTFKEGSAGFAHFQKMIADGSFEFKNKEKLRNLLSKEPMFEKAYSPKSEFAEVYEKLTLRDEHDLSKTTMVNMMDNVVEKKPIPRTTICTIYCRITKGVVQTVESVLNDEKAGTAKVKFTIAEIPIAPYYEELSSLAKSDLQSSFSEFRLRKPYTTEVVLKKYDEGWTVESKFM